VYSAIENEEDGPALSSSRELVGNAEWNRVHAFFDDIVYGSKAHHMASGNYQTNSNAKWYFHILSLVLVLSMSAQLTLDVHCEMKASLWKVITSSHSVTSDVKDNFQHNRDHTELEAAWEPAFCGEGMALWQGANLIFFTLEILARLMAGCQQFFQHKTQWWWNRLDLFLLILNYVDSIMDVVSAEGVDPRLRAINALRILRVLRLVEFSPTLQSMIYSILACRYALACSVFLIVVYTMGFSMFFMQIALYYVRLRKDDMSPADFKSIVENWNGVFDATMSLVYAITGGISWQELSEPFVHMGGHFVGSIWTACFTTYIVTTTIGLLNVLTGIFVSQSGNFANVSIDAAIDKAGRKMAEIKEDSSVLFNMIRDNAETEEDFLTEEQIREAIKDDEIKYMFAYLDIDLMDPAQMVKSFDINHTNNVDLEEFRVGCMRLQGSAKPCEVQATLELALEMRHLMDDMDKKVDDMDKKVDDLMQVCTGDRRATTA
jgi:hypothetical protein